MRGSSRPELGLEIVDFELLVRSWSEDDVFQRIILERCQLAVESADCGRSVRVVDLPDKAHLLV